MSLMTPRSPFQRFTAGAVAAALLVTAPGLPFHRAWAEGVRVAVGNAGGVVVAIPGVLALPPGANAAGPFNPLAINGIAGKSLISSGMGAVKRPAGAALGVPVEGVPGLERVLPVELIGGNEARETAASIAEDPVVHEAAPAFAEASATLAEPLRWAASKDIGLADAHAFGGDIARVLESLGAGRRTDPLPVVQAHSYAGLQPAAPALPPAHSGPLASGVVEGWAGELSAREVPKPAVGERPAYPVLQKAYEAGKRRFNMLSAAAFAAIGGITVSSAVGLFMASGMHGLHASALWLTGILMLPAVGSMWERLRRSTPKELPELSREMHPEVYEQVQSFVEKAGLPMPKLLLWEMDAPNAAAMGFHLPVVTKSYVLFTTNILETMPPAALAGVVGHELSHIRHNDLVWKIASKVLTFALFVNLISLPLPAALIVGAIVAADLLEKYIGRQRELLADLGGAQLTGNPEPLAAGLLRLDVWGRLVAGSGGPVNRFDPGRLLHEHPATLTRAERLLGTVRRVGRAKSHGVRAPVAAYLAVAKQLTQWPVLAVAFMHGGLAAAGIAAAVYALFDLGLRANRMLRPVTVERVRRDFATYLSHPDPAIRKGVARALLDFPAEDLKTADGVLLAIDDALRGEKAQGVRKRLIQAKRIYARIDEMIREERLAFQKALNQAIAERLEAEAGQGRIQELQDGDREGLLALLPEKAPKAPAKSGVALPDRAAVAAMKVRLAAAEPRGPPALFAVAHPMLGVIVRFWHLDAATGEAWISKPVWDSLGEKSRAGLLYYLSSRIAAERFLNSAGKQWIEGTRETEAVHAALRGVTPTGFLHGVGITEFRAARQFKSWIVEQHRAGKPQKAPLKERLRALAQSVWSLLEMAAVGRRDSPNAPSRGDRLTALAFAVASAVALSAMAGWLAFPVGLLNYFTALRFVMMDWSKGIAWQVKPVLWLMPSLLLETIGIAVGHPLLGALLWWCQSWATSYLLRQNFKRNVPSPSEVALAVLSNLSMGMYVLGNAHWSAPLGILAMVAFYFHLARHQRQGLLAYGLSGAALVGLYAGLLTFLGPIVAAFGLVLAAQFLGNRLTRGLKPGDENPLSILRRCFLR